MNSWNRAGGPSGAKGVVSPKMEKDKADAPGIGLDFSTLPSLPGLIAGKARGPARTHRQNVIVRPARGHTRLPAPVSAGARRLSLVPHDAAPPCGRPAERRRLQHAEELPMTINAGRLALAALISTCALAGAAHAWDRGPVQTFAVLPADATGPEGLAVGKDGNVYVTTFGFTHTGPVAGPGKLYVFNDDGRLLRQLSIAGTSAQLLGVGFHPTTNAFLVIDFGAKNVRNVDKNTGASSVFMTLPPPMQPAAGLNALTFDSSGNVYVSDSFQGIIWKTGPGGGVATQWVTDPLLTTTGVPPFGANGLGFNRAGNALFVANTGNDQIVKIPVTGGVAGTPVVFTNSINGADGLVLDRNDNIWVAANQADEIVVVDPTGKAIAKLGDFNGIDPDGVARGLIFPASPDFSKDGQWLYVTNLTLDLRLFGLAQSVDSQWTQQVQRYSIGRIRARIPPVGDGNGPH
jgi:sugar lactone lactonase YvrE